MFVLVFFYEEKKYSVLKLKGAVKKSDLQMMNLHTWDTKKSVETKWRDGVYPANFLHFGENRNDMELLIDGLVDGSITSEEIPVLQNVEGLKKRSRTHVQEEAVSETVELQQSKRQKLAAIKRCRNLKEQIILSKVKENILGHSEVKTCSTCSSLNLELTVLKKQATELAGELQSKTEAVEYYKMKYRDLKKKYKLSKKNKEKVETENPDLVKIGQHLHIDKRRLALCRVTDFSKYTCDLMDVVFGRENLATSVLRGIKGTSKKVLGPNYVSDIQGHVACKFNVNVSLVRATMRNKLNSASKAVKCEKMQ
ncbi:hypothetical protein AVEN_10322-1 [Araneus ventricosus]|uniref:BEN domain-containing protein n=1 Tax=Araneus ventricosus TaxID=182803 RepID=A0A4Y2P7P5_ARAVE|nr:hypothetical protein AVEN_10322-1 [Araneus ventricosus]